MNMHAIDIESGSEVQSGGTAFYRLHDDMLEFLHKCETKHGILGFEWDGSRNFGVILRQKFDSNRDGSTGSELP